MNNRSKGLLLSAIFALTGLFLIDVELASSVDPVAAPATTTATTAAATPSTAAATTANIAKAKDPGARPGSGAAGAAIPGLTPNQLKL